MKWKKQNSDPALLAALSAVRNDLLELGAANPLINYKDSATRGISNLQISPLTAFEQIIAKQGDLILTTDSDYSRAECSTRTGARSFQCLEDAEDSEVIRPSAKAEPLVVSVPLAKAELDNRLLSIQYASKASLEEDGTTTLYLALGSLKWRKAGSGDVVYSAPLLLIPVQIERTAASNEFRIFYSGDELRPNVCLCELMKSYNVLMPSFPEARLIKLSHYFEAVQKAVVSQPFWYVDIESVALGIFAFSKLLIYTDLDPSSWPSNTLLEHETVKTLLSGGAFNRESSLDDDDDSLDDYVLARVPKQVLDADSSQLQAILEAGKGSNVVIQGPPGTGKSQTIVNIIADALSNNKTILFVSDKMAALEVVRRRLEGVGLGETVLEFHSNRLKSRSIFQQLRKTLDLSYMPSPILQGQTLLDHSALEISQKYLNTYCEAVNAPAAQTGESVYEIFGTLMKLTQSFQSIALPMLEFPEARLWSSAELQKRREAIQQLQISLATCGVPRQNPFWGITTFVHSPTAREKLRHALNATEKALSELIAHRDELIFLLKAPLPHTWQELRAIEQICQDLIAAPTMDGLDLSSPVWSAQREQIQEALLTGKTLSEIRAKWTGIIGNDAWSKDVTKLGELARDLRSRWRKPSADQNWSLRRGIESLVLGAPPQTIEGVVTVLEAISTYQILSRRLESFCTPLSELFGKTWNAEDSDWPLFLSQATWLFAVLKKLGVSALPLWLADVMSEKNDHVKIKMAIASIEKQYRIFLSNKDEVEAILGIGPEAEGLSILRSANENLDQLHYAYASLANKVHELNSLSRYLKVRADTLESVGENVIAIAETWANASTHLADLFEYVRLSALVEKIFLEKPFLATFNDFQHTKYVQQFRQLDLACLHSNRVSIAIQHMERVRNSERYKTTFEFLLALSEVQNSLPTVRKLMMQAGEAIQNIKPVFMMSPHSVANFLPPEKVSFDLVIFDEASQLRPADALGAIARGKQTIVVGDSKQLPPTRFFETQSIYEAEGASVSDVESILGLFCSRNSSQRMLRWHYRSKHESLIALSNHLFYDNQLIVFPSPDRRRIGVGLVYNHLPLPHSVGTQIARDLEAQALSAAIIAHASAQMNLPASDRLSLGVATLNIRHRDLILQHLEFSKSVHPELEAYFSAEQHEPFFVKNLESVQGDERDVMYIGVGYGDPAINTPLQTLGPLVREGGERRLNVLFTRARKRCEVFSTIKASDISITEKSPSGLVAFRKFLSFAENARINSSVRTENGFVSSFETQVAEAIERFGYTVQRNVGLAGFYLDLAVVDPREPNRYMLGILCDGRSYDEARSSRDRDRLREQALFEMGWNIYRVWSTSWFLDRQQEEQKLATVLAQITPSQMQSEDSAMLMSR